MNPASCARPGCATTPAAWLAYDYGARCAWIDDQPDDGTGKIGKWPLCERHADNLRVPRGWFCVDRRGSQLATATVALVTPGARATDGGGPEKGASVEDEAGETGQPEQPERRQRTTASRLTAIL